MTTGVAAWIRCDLQASHRCLVEVGGDTHSPGTVAFAAREEGWKLGRRSGSKPRYDICPPCRESSRE